MTDDREVKPTAEHWEKAVEKQRAFWREEYEFARRRGYSDKMRQMNDYYQVSLNIEAEARRIAGERAPTDPATAGADRAPSEEPPPHAPPR